MPESLDIMAAIDAAAERINSVSRKIHDWKELGSQEFKSSSLLKEELAGLGFSIQGDLSVPADLVPGGVARTAFRAELKGRGDGPTVTLMLEYDALPGLGHACGHNLISSSGLAAAAGLAKAMPGLPGRLLVIGTPHEEGGSYGQGKVALLEGGWFQGSDLVLITHPYDRWSLDQRLLASKMGRFTFHGRPSHAACAPHLGINALDAVRLTFNAVDMLRQQVREDARIHGIVTNGGERTNIIPELAQAEFQVRALDTPYMLATYARVVNCTKAGELATGAKLEFKEPRTYLAAPVIVPEFIQEVADHLPRVGVPASELKPLAGLGSSDLGNVGQDFPTVNLSFKIAPEGTTPHSAAFREAARSEQGFRASLIAGQALALTAADLLTRPDKVAVIKQSFARRKSALGA